MTTENFEIIHDKFNTYGICSEVIISLQQYSRISNNNNNNNAELETHAGYWAVRFQFETSSLFTIILRQCSTPYKPSTS
jgi:hypothetical protein